MTHIIKTGEEEKYSFWHDCVKYHLHYCEEYYPEHLQNLVDNGEIYRYPDELDIKVTDAVMEQAKILMRNNREYQIANEIGDLYKIGAIGNNCQQEARDMVFAAMVHV